MTTSAIEPLLSVRELSAQLGLSKDQIYRLARTRDLTRRLPHRVIAGALRFLPSEIRAWQDAQPGFKPVEPSRPVPAMDPLDGIEGADRFL